MSIVGVEINPRVNKPNVKRGVFKFNLHNGGTLKVKDATFRHLGGTDMAFVVHLNNWGNDLTLTADHTVFESTYTAIRIFNSGPYMNYVTVTNKSAIKGASRAVWVHIYPNPYPDTGGFNITISSDTNITGVLRVGNTNVASFESYNRE